MTKKYAMTATEVMEVIPNRYPIMFIDYVDEISENKIVATKNVTINEEVFNGHFPGNPTFPGVLILKKEEFQGKMAYIGAIDKAKFRQKVTPGDVMKLEFEITKFRGKVGTADAAAYVDGKKVTTCQFTFIVDEAAEQTN